MTGDLPQLLCVSPLHPLPNCPPLYVWVTARVLPAVGDRKVKRVSQFLHLHDFVDPCVICTLLGQFCDYSGVSMAPRMMENGGKHYAPNSQDGFMVMILGGHAGKGSSNLVAGWA